MTGQRQSHGSIYQRGVNSWRIVVSAGRDPETGKPATVRETVRGSKRDAIRRRNELRDQVAKGTATQDARETVAAFMERYIAHREQIGKVRPKTAVVYRGYVRREVVPAIGSLRVSEVRVFHVQKIMDAALERGLSPTSVVQLHRIMRSAFKWAVRSQLIQFNPLDAVEAPVIEAPELVTPTAAQVATLLSAAPVRYRVALSVAAMTGVRRGELAGLRWPDMALDGPRPSLRVEGSLQRVAGTLRIVEPKTKRSKRKIPLPPSVVTMLRRHRIEQNERRLLAGAAWGSGDFVFESGAGQPVDPDAITHAFQRARQAAGIDGVRLHDLRHSFATLQMASGTHARVVSDALGHARVSFTLDTYSHPDEEMAQPIASTMEDALGAAIAGTPS